MQSAQDEKNGEMSTWRRWAGRRKTAFLAEKVQTQYAAKLQDKVTKAALGDVAKLELVAGITADGAAGDGSGTAGGAAGAGGTPHNQPPGRSRDAHTVGDRRATAHSQFLQDLRTNLQGPSAMSMYPIEGGKARAREGDEEDGRPASASRTESRQSPSVGSAVCGSG
jgi:hypothetical protein